MLRSVSALILSLSVVCLAHAETKAVDVYTQEQLLDMIRGGYYFAQVKKDDCQLVQDIEARAEVLKQPLYQFLWGEMFIHGVCVKADPARGVSMLKEAAEQGSAEAMLKIAHYYEEGKYVFKDKNRAVLYVLPAAANGDLLARMALVRLYNEGYGSPRDYELAYHWLYNEVFGDENMKQNAWKLLQQLESKMPASSVARARGEHMWSY